MYNKKVRSIKIWICMHSYLTFSLLAVNDMQTNNTIEFCRKKIQIIVDPIIIFAIFAITEVYLPHSS